MTTPPTAAISWHDMIMSNKDAGAIWASIFDRLKALALDAADPSTLVRDTSIPDRLLAEAAWELWQAFPTSAPRVISALMEFWKSSTTTGTAILILDALSLRELPLIVNAGRARGTEPTRIEVRGSEVPTETDQFAAALGLPGRSKLYNNQAPASFVFGGADTYSDVLDAPFADCVSIVPTKPRVFLWHKWPDEPLIHLHEDKPDGDKVVSQATKKELTSDGFWALVNRMRQGRKLIITGDHGYATRRGFATEIADDDTKKLLREHFGQKRSTKIDPQRPWPHRHVPPLVIENNGHLVVMGQRWWAAAGGYPYLCHRGLTLLEAAVPVIEYPSA